MFKLIFKRAVNRDRSGSATFETLERRRLLSVSAETVPNGPYTLGVTAISSTQLNLLWHDNSAVENGFIVERRSGAGVFATVATLGVNATTYFDTNLAAGVSYTYRVHAFNAHGDSSATNESSGSPFAAGGTGAASGSSSQTVSGGGAAGFFPVGVYYQPTWTFDSWKSRGVNTLYGYESVGGSVSMAQFDAAAAARGFQEIRQPAARPSSDRSVANLTAWLTPIDEPDLHGTTPASLAQQYGTLRSINSTRPIITTYSGGYVLGWQGAISAATYGSYLKSTDWVAADIYPVGGWGLPNKINAVGQLVDKLQALAPGKKQFAFIETSNPNLSFVPHDRGVTPDEFRAEVWDSVIHGASGIVYFPQQIGGFNYDATPANVASEMTTQNARLQQYGAALASPENPAPVGMTVTGPLETTWRTYNGRTYFFVLNLSAKHAANQQITIAGVNSSSSVTVDGEARTVPLAGGVITDSFKPYEMHVYVV